MEIQGKVILILPQQTGVGRNGNPWAVQPFVIETIEQYPRKVHIELFGEDRINNNPFAIDDVVNVSFDIESHEFNSRWYTSIRAWKVEKESKPAGGSAPASNQPPVDSAPLPEAPEEQSSTLPF